MKLLLDENLSRRLVKLIIDLFPGLSHVAFENLLQLPDIVIWEYCKLHEFTIVTADSDFYELATAYGHPPKVIWLRGCDYPTSEAERLVRSQAIRVTDFFSDTERSVLMLRP